MWKSDVDINQVVELRVKPNVYFGFGAIHKMEEVAKDMKVKGLDKVLVVSGKTLINLLVLGKLLKKH